jgi:hypothetical protein
MNTQDPYCVLDADIAEALADGLSPIELSSAERDRMRARILTRVTAAPPSGMVTIRAHEGEWRDLAPGITIKMLHEDTVLNAMSYLVRMGAGARAPVHTHAQEEHCLVLEGEVTIGDHLMRSGDWHIAQPGSTHADFRTTTGCLLFIRAEMAAHF